VLPNNVHDRLFGVPKGFSTSSAKIVLWLVRFVFLAMAIGIATGFLFLLMSTGAGSLQFDWRGVVAFSLVLLTTVFIIWADVANRHKQITTISAVFFGLLIGFVLSLLFWQALQPIVTEYLAQNSRLERILHLFITLIACYLAVSMLLQTKDDFRFLIPYVEFSKQLKGAKPLVVDTSVIIDGRIADICDTGIIDSKLVVPRFVLQELQGIADSSDKVRRARGRRGLDILKRMQSNPRIEVQLHDGNLAELREVQKVDERLVVLAKVLSGRVVTNDFNLNKICQVQSVEVINLNELANALKIVALPGERMTVRIVKQGDQIGQGVGYLDDGTMVVVEHGRNAIGREVSIVVTSVLQTPAGRMIFGRIDGDSTPPPGHHEERGGAPLAGR
jgi:uncharacterized protein YacL